jgi:hypothetical protein
LVASFKRWPWATTSWVTCEAQDAHGNYVRCLSMNPRLAQVVAALKSELAVFRLARRASRWDDR